MAGKRLSVGLFLDDKQFQTGLKRASNSMKRFGKQMAQTGASLSTKLTLPIGAAAVASVKMASDFEESLNKTRVAFGESSTEVEAFAKTTLKNFGLAEGSALDMASMFGDMATSMGLTQQQAGGMATSLVGLAGDLASFKNIGIEQAQTALAGIFTGETESLKKLGIVMTEANLKQFGYNKNMSQAEKIGIRYKAIIEATKNAQGDYLRTSDGVANSTRTLTESVKELATDFGTLLLPVASKVIAKGQQLVDFFRNLSTEQKETIIQVAGVVAVVGPTLVVFGKLVTILGTATKALRAFNLMMAANPAVLIATAIAGVVAAIVFFATSSSETAIKVRNAFRKMANGVLNALNLMIEGLNFFRDEQNKIKPIEPFKLEEPLKETANAAEEATKAVKDLQNTTNNFKPFQPLKLSEDQKGTGRKTEAREITLMPKIDPKAIEPIKATTDVITENFYNATEAAEDLKNKMEETANVAGSAFMSMADNSEASLGEMAAGAANAAREIIKIEAAKAVAGFASSIFVSVPFPINLMLAAAAGAVAGSLFAKIIPPFAEGGLVSGATLGMVGEGRGTSMVNPEVIAPLDKLQGMLNQGGSTEVFGRISGSDILLSSDRARGNRKRTRGN
tara:strand:+ start:6770 stop:8635 length:1866 start_codon:yes stop_codon:yes gene_type:complete